MKERKQIFNIIPYIPILGLILVYVFKNKYRGFKIDKKTHLTLLTAIIQALSVSAAIIYLVEKYLF